MQLSVHNISHCIKWLRSINALPGYRRHPFSTNVVRIELVSFFLISLNPECHVPGNSGSNVLCLRQLAGSGHLRIRTLSRFTHYQLFSFIILRIIVFLVAVQSACVCLVYFPTLPTLGDMYM